MFGIMLLFATPAMLSAQDKCPQVMVSSSAQPGGKIGFTGMVHGGDPNLTPTYNWMISAGVIASGQGTSTIAVEAEPHDFVTATLDVGGYDRSCPASESASEEAQPPEAPDCPQLFLVTESSARGNIFAAQLIPEVPGAKWVWSISEGKILRGQGTTRIDVAAKSGRTVTGTISVEGAGEGCTLSQSEALLIQ